MILGHRHQHTKVLTKKKGGKPRLTDVVHNTVVLHIGVHPPRTFASPPSQDFRWYTAFSEGELEDREALLGLEDAEWSCLFQFAKESHGVLK